MARLTPAPPTPEQNHLLAALSAAERERLYPHLQLAEMPLGKVVYEPGDVEGPHGHAARADRVCATTHRGSARRPILFRA